MKKQILAALAVGSAFAIQPAYAADVCSGLGCTGIGLANYTYVVGSAASNVSGATGYNGTVGAGGPGVKFTSSTDNLNVDPVFSPGGLSITSATGEGWPISIYDLDQLSFTLAPGYSFTSAYFDLTPGGFFDFSDSVTVHYSGGGSETVSLDSSIFGGSDNWFGVTTTPGQTLTGLTFTGGRGGDGWGSLASLKLAGVSGTTPAVPEPSTWIMMILGFGLVGGALRRRQSDAVRVRYA